MGEEALTIPTMETSIRSRPEKLSQPPEWHTGSFRCLSQQDNIESVVTQYTEHTPVFPLDEPKPTSMFHLLQDVEPKIKSISMFISARLQPSAYPWKLRQATLSEEPASQTAGSGSLCGSEWSHPGGGESIWTWRVSCFSSGVTGLQ